MGRSPSVLQQLNRRRGYFGKSNCHEAMRKSAQPDVSAVTLILKRESSALLYIKLPPPFPIFLLFRKNYISLNKKENEGSIGSTHLKLEFTPAVSPCFAR